MRLVFGLVLVLGITLAGFAVYMARGIINQNAAALQRERAARAQVIPTVKVYVAKTNLAYGEVLKKDEVEAIDWPQNALPKTAFTDLAKLFPPGPDKTRVMLRATEKFEPILTSAVTAPGKDAGITSRLEAGMRAFAIKVGLATGMSGFLRPGDRVDIYWTGTSQVSRSEVTRLILPGIKVIAVDQSADTSKSTAPTIARTVTVEATPQQVAILAQAQATGNMSMSLVGSTDNTVASAVEVDTNRLLGLTDRKAAPPPVKKKVCTVRQRTGATVIDVPIPCTN